MHPFGGARRATAGTWSSLNTSLPRDHGGARAGLPRGASAGSGMARGRRQLEPRKGRAPLAAGPGHRHGIQGTDNIRAEIHSKGSAQALGCPRAGLRARETGGGGRPARFCQEETHVLAEQFSSMEHDARSVFRISQTKRSKPHSMDRPSTAAKHDPPHRTTFIEERRTARRKLMSVPSSAATTRSSGNSRGSVGRWVFAEVERDLISGAHPGGALPRGQVGGSDHATDRIDRGPAVQLRCEDGPRESRRRLAHHLCQATSGIDPPATPKTDPPKKRRMLLKWWVFR